MNDALAKPMLDLAARVAWLAAGRVEPNPLVGCVLVRDGAIIGLGHHRRFGGPHAEVEALADCRRRGHEPRGSTAYVTLEPCAHTGKTPPCTEALIAAQVARVVIAREDPNPAAAGGAERLRAAGIAVEFSTASPRATRLAEPFIKRTLTGLPWVIAKWAQTIDGRIATRNGESKWISSERSRRQVHRVRARVDAIITGIGTVLADDPELTARGVSVRRIARRVVIDPQGRMPKEARLRRTVGLAPLLHVTGVGRGQRAGVETDCPGCEVLRLPLRNELVDVREVLRHLAEKHDASNVLVESGPGLMGHILREGLADELHVYTGPMIFADDQSLPAARGAEVETLAEARRFRLCETRRIEDDVLMVYRRPM